MGKLLREVSIREHGELAIKGIYCVAIDAFGGSRYSQAQITDLVAYTNPGIRRAVKSSGLRQPGPPQTLLEPVDTTFSLRPPTAENLYKHLPGEPQKGSARPISELDRPPGGYRPL